MALSEKQKKAISEGKKETQAVRNYMKALEDGLDSRRSPVEAAEKKAAQLAEKFEAETDPLKKLEIAQAQIEAESEAVKLEDTPDFEEIEEKFIQYAKSYSERKGITYSAWRALGVAAGTLKKAGIPQTRRPKAS